MKHGDFTGSSALHRECWELLPWIANERASARELTRVEPHLRECDECKQELEAQRRLREGIRAEDAVVLAPQTSLQKLMQRIDEDASAEDAQALRGPARVASRRLRWLPIAAAMQGVVIAALLGALWWQSRETLTAPRFSTLTSQTTVVRGPVLRVVFADDVALEDVSQILRSIDAQIVAGPSEAGVYTLGFVETAARPAVADDALARLRSDARVIFSEAAVARSESP